MYNLHQRDGSEKMATPYLARVWKQFGLTYACDGAYSLMDWTFMKTECVSAERYPASRP